MLSYWDKPSQEPTGIRKYGAAHPPRVRCASWVQGACPLLGFGARSPDVAGRQKRAYGRDERKKACQAGAEDQGLLVGGYQVDSGSPGGLPAGFEKLEAFALEA